jgi:hypothetical protein
MSDANLSSKCAKEKIEGLWWLNVGSKLKKRIFKTLREVDEYKVFHIIKKTFTRNHKGVSKFLKLDEVLNLYSNLNNLWS